MGTKRAALMHEVASRGSPPAGPIDTDSPHVLLNTVLAAARALFLGDGVAAPVGRARGCVPADCLGLTLAGSMPSWTSCFILWALNCTSATYVLQSRCASAALAMAT